MSSTTRRSPDDCSLVLSLIPLNIRARKCFSKYNADRFRRSSYELDPNAKRSKIDYRESTPTKDESGGTSKQGVDEPELQLSLNHPPRNPNNGFVFGSDPEKCDVYLGERRDYISAITFRIVITKELLLAMCAESTANKIVVSYGDGEKEKERYRYNWILFEKKPNMTVTLVNGLQFQFRIPDHGESRRKHEQLKQNYIEKTCGGSLSIDELHSETHNPGGSLPRPPYKKIYTKLEKLGNGTFGSVYEVREASTAKVFAMKMLSKEHENFRDYRLAHKLLEKESDLLAMLAHPRIVKRYDLFAGFGSLCLVMEMLPQGDLHKLLKQAPESKLSIIDVSAVLHQGLQALEYLHGKRVTHRDLKLANIMVEQCSPVIKIKLVDFGLSNAPLQGANNSSWMSDQCGTWRYMAPEQWAGQNYKNIVDIWALAVVIMDCMAISPQEQAAKNRLYGPGCDKKSWCDWLIAHLDCAFQVQTEPIEEHVLYILWQHMLQEGEFRRLGANLLLKMFRPFFHYIEQMEAVGDKEASSGALPEDKSDPTLGKLLYLAKQHCRWQSRERENARNGVKNVEVQMAKAAKKDREKRKPKAPPPPYVDENGQQFSGAAVIKRRVKASPGEKRDRKPDNPDPAVAGSDSRKKQRT